MTLVYVGLGANIGRPVATLYAAELRLRDLPGVRMLRHSSLYRTAPQGVVDQPHFVNSVVEIETDVAPAELVRWFKTIEIELGREPTTRWGPRVIDLDLLLYGDLQVHTPELTVPHAEMWRRHFVLAPLAELRPDLHTPGEPILDVCAALAASQDVQRIDVPPT